MIRNYLVTAWRNLRREPLYAGINIAGLAIGIACCLLIVQYMQDELSYDRFPERADRIYRIVTEINFGGKHAYYATAPAPMGPTLVQELPEVESSFRFREWGDWLVRREGETTNTKEAKVAYADSTFFDFFSAPVLAGDPATALKAPNSVAISASCARRHFRSPEEAVGQTLIFDDEYPYQVSAVYQDIPHNAHFHFDLLLAMSGYEDSRSPVWLSNNYHTYFTLRPGINPDVVVDKLPDLFKKYAGPQVLQLLDKSIEEIEQTGQGVFYELQPMRDIHLRSDLVGELEANGDIAYVYLFGSIALFILFIACINFMNLATARSANRAREVGVRKTLGALRPQLIRQFLTESVLMSLIAVFLGLALVKSVQGTFNQLVGKNLELSLNSPFFWGALLGGALVVGLLAGSYPAFFLSAFRPIETLKGKLRIGLSSGRLRNGLVVFQFVISIFLIIGTLVVNDQMHFIRSKKLGFDRDQVLLVHDAYALADQKEAFRQEVERWPEVQSTSYSSFLPVASSRSNNPYWPEGKMTETNSVSMQSWSVDEEYIPTMGMELIRGRNFSRDMLTDSNAVIINEQAAALYGFDDPIGKRISTLDDFNSGQQNAVSYTIIGVVKNFHFESLRQGVDALGLFLGRSSGYLAIRYRSDQPGAIISRLEQQWKKMAPSQPFAHSFLDERFNAMYESEQRTGQIFLLFAGLAIFVACLGLFALATFTAERRTKEIGVRKVMGATSADIFGLLSGEFTRWVALSYLIALPLGWYFARRWLQDFEYRTNLSVWTFLAAAAVALLVALLTVSFQAWRAARRNPVEALRYE